MIVRAPESEPVYFRVPQGNLVRSLLFSFLLCCVAHPFSELECFPLCCVESGVVGCFPLCCAESGVVGSRKFVVAIRFEIFRGSRAEIFLVDIFHLEVAPQALSVTRSPHVVILVPSSSALALIKSFQESGVVGLETMELRLKFFVSEECAEV